MDTKAMPQTLMEALRYFADDDTCLAFLVDLRWGKDGVRCPSCGGADVSFLKTRRVWKCKTDHPKRQFSIKVGTIFEDSPISLDKWLAAMWLLANAKNGISSYEVGRSLGITQKSAWFMMHRIRLAMQDGTIEKLRGRVEADETYIGGKVHNMHKGKKLRVMGGRRGGTYAKAIVAGMLERETGRVRAEVIPTAYGGVLPALVRKHVETGSELITDSLIGYRALGLSGDFVHNFVNHVREYVRGHVHTNGIENFWALLKRGIKGTYVNVEPFHLHRYVDEQAHRFNNRKRTDLARFMDVAKTILGRRLTYKALTVATT